MDRQRIEDDNEKYNGQLMTIDKLKKYLEELEISKMTTFYLENRNWFVKDCVDYYGNTEMNKKNGKREKDEAERNDEEIQQRF